MKNHQKNLVLLFIFSVLCHSFSNANDPAQELAQVKGKAEQLEKNLAAVSQTNEQLKQALQSTQDELKALKEDVNLYLKILGIGCGVVFAAGLFQTFFWAQQQIRRQIGKTISQNKEALLRLVDLQELEEKYKAATPVKVVSPDADARAAFEQTFGNMGFKNLAHHTGIKPEKFEEKLVILNQLDKDQVNGFINASDEKTWFIAYTKGQLDRHDRLNMANSPMTLYARLMETLKYSKIAK